MGLGKKEIVFGFCLLFAVLLLGSVSAFSLVDWVKGFFGGKEYAMSPQEINLINNGDAEAGTIAGWSGFNGVTITDKKSGNYSFYANGSKTIQSSNLIPIDVNKNYTLSGWFKSKGANNSKIYFGFVPYDANQKQINVGSINARAGTETELYNPLISNDKAIYIKNCSGWTKSPNAYIAFNVDNSGNYNDLPNRNLSSRGITNITNYRSYCIINLSNSAGVNAMNGTKVREHMDSSTYIYSAAAGVFVPYYWINYNATISGENKYGNAAGKWWRGTKYAKILILANYGQNTNYSLFVDDLSLKESCSMKEISRVCSGNNLLINTLTDSCVYTNASQLCRYGCLNGACIKGIADFLIEGDLYSFKYVSGTETKGKCGFISASDCDSYEAVYNSSDGISKFSVLVENHKSLTQEQIIQEAKSRFGDALQIDYFNEEIDGKRATGNILFQENHKDYSVDLIWKSGEKVISANIKFNESDNSKEVSQDLSRIFVDYLIKHPSDIKSKCSDSDVNSTYKDGKNYFQKGSVVNTIDKATEDSCYQANDLTEGYCDSNYTYFDYISCADRNSSCFNGRCINLRDNSVCAGLKYIAKNPSEYKPDSRFDYSTYNYSNTGEWWSDGVLKNYTRYYSRWDADFYDEEKKNYERVYTNLDLIIFNDTGFNALEYVRQEINGRVCNAKNVWVGDRMQVIYVCKDIWDLAHEESKPSRTANSILYIWAKGNIAIRLSFYSYNYDYSFEITNEVSQSANLEKFNTFLEKLNNNEMKYVSIDKWISQFVERFLDDSINLCGSDLTGIKDKYGEECNPSWQCGTEPVICPPHGEQKLICIDSNCDETRESTIYCSPGICSGCYVPKWFGYLENTKCIPYGFRFAQEDGDREKLEERTELNSNGEVEFEIKIIDDYTAYMKLTVGAIFGGEHNETVFEETIYEGSKHTIYLQDYGEENIEFKVDRIVPGKDGNNGFVYLTVIGKRDAYCDIDGEIKQQKKKDYNGKLAECQNNYECRSNVCSNGKCLEVEEVINEAGNMKSLLYRVLCRLINLFDNDDYDQCIYNYLGSMSSSGGGSGGGGSSSPQIPQ